MADLVYDSLLIALENAETDEERAELEEIRQEMIAANGGHDFEAHLSISPGGLDGLRAA